MIIKKSVRRPAQSDGNILVYVADKQDPSTPAPLPWLAVTQEINELSGWQLRTTDHILPKDPLQFYSLSSSSPSHGVEML